MKARVKSFFKLFLDAFKGWKEDNCLSMGAAVAFYSMLSMAPLLVLVITVAGLVIGRDEAQQLLLTQLSGLLGDSGAEGIKNILDGASTQKEGIFNTIVSGLVLLVGATTVMGELQDDLNRIWKATAAKASGIWGQIRKRLLSFSLIVVIGFLLLMSLALSAAVAYVGTHLFAGMESVAHVLEFVASLLVTTMLFAMTFKILPARRIPWSDVFFGAFVTALLFGIGKFAIGLYIGKSAVASDFGAAGTLVAAIVWVYYSSQIFFFGAELTRAWSVSRGSRSTEAANSEFSNDQAAMIDRAEKIVKGKDPILLEKRV